MLNGGPFGLLPFFTGSDFGGVDKMTRQMFQGQRALESISFASKGSAFGLAHSMDMSKLLPKMLPNMGGVLQNGGIMALNALAAQSHDALSKLRNTDQMCSPFNNPTDKIWRSLHRHNMASNRAAGLFIDESVSPAGMLFGSIYPDSEEQSDSPFMGSIYRHKDFPDLRDDPQFSRKRLVVDIDIDVRCSRCGKILRVKDYDQIVTSYTNIDVRLNILPWCACMKDWDGSSKDLLRSYGGLNQVPLLLLLIAGDGKGDGKSVGVLKLVSDQDDPIADM